MPYLDVSMETPSNCNKSKMTNRMATMQFLYTSNTSLSLSLSLSLSIYLCIYPSLSLSFFLSLSLSLSIYLFLSFYVSICTPKANMYFIPSSQCWSTSTRAGATTAGTSSPPGWTPAWRSIASTRSSTGGSDWPGSTASTRCSSALSKKWRPTHP